MKRNWEYKKLGECGVVITGNTPSKKDVANYSSNDFCFVKPNDIEKDGITYINQTCEYVSKKAFEKSRRLSKGAVLTTCIGIIGKVAILEVDAICNQQINAIIPNANMESKFLAYSILSIRNYLTQKANAPVVPIINKGDFSDVSIPVPPLEEQSRIVAELDLLTGIIDKQNAQLKELDNLAQAIFYDMFGDPIENPNGFDFQPLYKLCLSICGGGTPSKKISSYWEGGDIPWVTSKDMKTTYIDDSQIHITKEGLDNSSAQILPVNSILMVLRSGILKHSLPVAITTNNVTINQDLKAFVLKQDVVVPIFFLYQIKAYSNFLLGMVRAVTADNIEFSNVKNLSMLVPPLSLQQSFAEKIQSIEKQKESIRASIADTQKLLDYTMDKHFG